MLAKVARAIHYAHQQGILHRDLKPANILIDLKGEPHITDFGLAKQLESAEDLTLSGAILGTPNYMAPEQAAGKNKLVTTAADVFSLGAIFYELLTGRPPFRADTPMETLRQVVEQEPQRPSSINQRVDRDLETICLKCLQKDSSRRYGSAEALAEDLERWLRHEPIRARRTYLWEHALKWTKRRPALAALLFLALIAPAAIIAVLIITGADVRRERNNAWQQEQKAIAAATRAEAEAARAEAEALRANEAKEQTRQNLYAADMLLAQHALDDGNLGLARSLMQAHSPKFGVPASSGSGTNRPKAEFQADMRGFEWRLLWKRCQGDQLFTLHGHSNEVHSMDFSRDSQILASGDGAGLVKLWNVAARGPFITFAASSQPIVSISFSMDGNALATADATGLVRVWNLTSREVVWERQGREGQGAQLSPVSTLIGFSTGVSSSYTNQAAWVVDWTTGKETLRVASGSGFAAFSPDGKLAYIIRSSPTRTELRDLATGQVVKTILKLNGSVVPSPDGKCFVSPFPYYERGQTLIVDLTTEKPPALLGITSVEGEARAFSPDSALLAYGGSDQTVRLWSLATQQELARLLGHVEGVTGVAFSPDGKLLASSSRDHTVMLWTPFWQKHSVIISNAWAPYVLSPDGRSLASCDKRLGATNVLVWDLATHRPTTIAGAVAPEFFSPDSQTLFVRGPLSPAGVLPLSRWDLKAPTNPPGIALLDLKNTNLLGWTACTPDGHLYAVGQHWSKGISFWNPLTGQAVSWASDDSTEAGIGAPKRFSPDGRRVASRSWADQIWLTDSATPHNRVVTKVVGSRELAFSADGKVLAVASEDHGIHLFETSALREIGILSGHQYTVFDVAFAPDGRTLASSDKGGVVKLWCWPARREVATILRDGGDPIYLKFTPDGNTLLGCDATRGLVHLWRAPTLAEIDRQP